MKYKDDYDMNILKRGISFLYTRIYNLFHSFEKEEIEPQDNFEREILKRSRKRTDINDHLLTIYRESIAIKPDLIVELGIRGGESTFVFERVAKKFNSVLISVDIEDCSNASQYEKWLFVQYDDIEFAKIFEKWCKERGIKPEIDILFIDTSHFYSHTKEEIKLWFPYLSSKAKVFFHDTNIDFIIKRKDGSLENGWDNKRGVIRAIEEFCGKDFNEKIEFEDECGEFGIKHFPFCSGLTILTKKSV
ncbi:conserved hypothetical protein [Thermotomaculum hydrothermale]|uniref:Class I SAM-dependent methyltransferase n=1 Tax=Thermotomaculum hydrothermale TaxID=981385 RepID=A0A7R6PG39_9BACT|nr:class I SAM-dependent methyltransferase [Thermotomaculum hydrothermale]BBB31959.1 conserved hypothetical protein [Thermotomaculum hydrothermale]